MERAERNVYLAVRVAIEDATADTVRTAAEGMLLKGPVRAALWEPLRGATAAVGAVADREVADLELIAQQSAMAGDALPSSWGRFAARVWGTTRRDTRRGTTRRGTSPW